MRTWWLIALAACGGSNNTTHDASIFLDAPSMHDAMHDAHVIHDAPADSPMIHDAHHDGGIILVDAPGFPDAGGGPCNVLTQTGCAAGEKCTWIEDGQGTGEIGCAPNGTVALGGACTYGPPGPTTGYDNCMGGDVCMHGQCETICDPSGGNPMCDQSHACQIYQGVFGSTGSELAGVCDPECDPLNDNDFDGSGSAFTKTGTICAQDQGCYGYPNSTARTHFTCAPVPAGSTMLFHRSVCDIASGCENPNGSPYLNGCAQGYLPLIYADNIGSMTIVCVALCAPADCYMGNCGTGNANAIGAAPHRCSNQDASGTFDTASNGDQCMYWWLFEQDPNTGIVEKSPYSDSVGICFDHSKYMLPDASGVASMTPWPACSSLPLTSTSTTCQGKTATTQADLSGCTAVDFGCVSTVTGGVMSMFTGPIHHHTPQIRAPYHHVSALHR